jgi:serine/threonine protein kinase
VTDLPLPHLLLLLLQLTRQVQRLHELGITHGDLKGNNVLINVDLISNEITGLGAADWGAATFLGNNTRQVYL